MKDVTNEAQGAESWETVPVALVGPRDLDEGPLIVHGLDSK